MEADAQTIEVIFYQKARQGFDVIHNGEGIPDSELPLICRCMDARKRNDLYKSKSIGYRGEAYNTLAKSSTLTVLTKHTDSDYAWRIRYNRYGDIQDIQ